MRQLQQFLKWQFLFPLQICNYHHYTHLHGVNYLNHFHHLSLTYKRHSYSSPVVPLFSVIPVVPWVLCNGSDLQLMIIQCRFHCF